MKWNRYVLASMAVVSAGAVIGVACTGDPVPATVPDASTTDTGAADAAIDTGKDAASDTGIDALAIGTGTFGKELYLPLVGTDGGATSAEYGIAVGDLNADKHLDLVVSGGALNSVLVYLGKGDGTFGAPVAYAAGSNPYYVAIADLTGDGKPDLATANSGSANVSVLIGGGNGTFSAPVNYAVSSSPVFVIAADVSGDGVKDLIATESGGGKVDVFVNVGNGTFGAAVPFTVPSPWNVVASDLNGDTKLDLVVGTSGNNVYVLLNNGTNTLFGAPTPYATDLPDAAVTSGAYATVVGDYNGDNAREVAVAKCAGTNALAFLPTASNGTLGAATAVTVIAGSVCLYDIAQGLLDPDGIPDLVMGGHAVYVRSSSLLDGGSEASIAAYVPDPGDAGASTVKTIAVGDLNEDGVQDLAAVVDGRPFVYILFGVKKQ